MLQITSINKETAIAPELVQNGNFSEIGSDLISNGDFSQEGSELITNGDFSATGTDLLADKNGDFESGSADWTVIENTGGSVTFASNQCQIISDGVLGNGVRQFILTTGKSYKVVIDIASNTNKFQIRLGDQIAVVSGSGVQTFYGVATNTDLLIYRETGEAVDVVLNSVSVKELGEDWTVGTGWSIGEDKAICDGSQTAQSNLYQTGIVPINKSYKVVFDIVVDAGSMVVAVGGSNAQPTITSSNTYTYYTQATAGDSNFYFSADADFIGSVTNVSVKELGEDWTVGTGWSIGEDKLIGSGAQSGYTSQANIFTIGVNKSYKLTLKVEDYTSGNFRILTNGTTYQSDAISGNGVKEIYFPSGAPSSGILLISWSGLFEGSITDISVKELDPDDDWILSSNHLSIGENKAKFTNSTIGQNINQQKFTIEENVSYRASFDLLDYVSGRCVWFTTGGTNQISENYEANGTGITFDFIGDVEGGTPGIRIQTAAITNNSFAVTNVSVKKLATYLDQSIYVTAADVQTIAQASVSYLIELKSMASQNSIYFIPTSITANNGRYTKMNFTVVSKDGITDPLDGIISFYDSDGGEDTYPMGFYEFKIYEQPIFPINLNPTLATKLLEKGTAFVQNISGNTSEITSEFKEYDPTLTQYVYSQ